MEGGGGQNIDTMASNEDERQWQFYILQKFINRSVTKKGEKKGSNLLCFEKGEIGGLTFFSPFFQSWNKKAIPK